MKDFPAGLAAKLASGVTTLCRCWRLERADATVLAFTDHDRDLVFGADTFQAESGLSASAWASRLGLAVDTIDAHGALSAEALTEEDLARGLWDGATVTLSVVDWSEVADRGVIFSGSIGEVERGPLAFRAELRSLAHALNQARGRIFGNTCDADLGDARCGVDLDDADFATSATVSAVDAARSIFRTAGLGAYSETWFARGLVTWTSGGNDGAAMEVKRHRMVGGVAVIELFTEIAFDIAPGDTFDIRAGCDKSIATCKAKFDNVENFRGFPAMPGNDWVASYPTRGEANTGVAIGVEGGGD